MRAPTAVIDSHAHLDHPRLAGDLEAVLQRAAAANVTGVVAVGTDLASSRAALAIAQRFSGRVFATAGVHPHDAGAFDDGDFPRLRELWQHPDVCAIGEIGLDYHYNFSPPRRQQEVFARQLQASHDSGLPVVIHVREAYDDAFALLRQAALPPGRGLLHCFSGGPRECDQALDLGLSLSFAGIVTFPKATALHEALLRVPENRLLVETDAPYLAPVPMRGRPNEPAFVAYTAAHCARLRQTPAARLCTATRDNAIRLFGLPLTPGTAEPESQVSDGV